MRRWFACFAAILCSLYAIQADDGIRQEPDWRHTKMMWAHLVGWGFGQTTEFDQFFSSPDYHSRRYNDRSLLGRYVQTNGGMWEGCYRQVRTAVEYGFDGLCIDFFQNFASSMSRFFAAAEGTPLKIALCIDGGFSKEKLVEELDTFIRQWENHPNACRIDGKMVIFSYTLGVSLDVWDEVLAELEARGRHAFYFGKPVHEAFMWGDPKPIARAMKTYDGIYDFGCNGFTAAEQRIRYQNVEKARELAGCPDTPLIAGITVGYLGSTNGCYRPFLNSQTFRSNWETAIEADADWVCITTWNDYVENTHFEPSLINRDSLVRMNLEYCNKWRGIPALSRPANPIFNYQDELEMGKDFTVDAIVGAYSGENTSISLFALNYTGEPLYQFDVFRPVQGELSVKEWRIPAEAMKEWRDGFMLRVAYSREGDEKPVWKDLGPVAIRYGHMESLRTMRIPYDEVGTLPCRLSIRTDENGNKTAHVAMDTWGYAGLVQIWRNGWPVAEREVELLKAPQHEIDIALPPPQTAADTYYVRLTGTSGRLCWSYPVIDRFDEESVMTEQPVIVTGASLDESWLIWSSRISRFDENKVEFASVRADDLYGYTFYFDVPVENDVYFKAVDNLLWAKNGGMHWNWYGSPKERRAAVVTETGPTGSEATFLRFDGVDDCMAVPSRSMPHGAYTVEVVCRPRKNGKEMTLFTSGDPNGAVELKLDAELRPVVTRMKDAPVKAPEALSENAWYHLAAQYDGRELRIYVNGELAASGKAAPVSIAYNAVPSIGSTDHQEKCYCGDIQAVHVQCGICNPEEFKLRF